jgi:hypothetical protein
MTQRIVLDTNVFIAALLGPRDASRQVGLASLQGRHQMMMSTSLALEYEDMANREAVIAQSGLSRTRLETLLEAIFHVCHWHRIYYTWRPNLPDAGTIPSWNLPLPAARGSAEEGLRVLDELDARDVGRASQ